MPGAFAKTLSERFGRVKVCWQHDWKAPIGKPLEIREDEHGLHVKAMISDTAVGRDVRTLMKDGVVSELSIGYDVIQDAWRDDNGKSVRLLKELRLYEISPVTMAANPMAIITGVKAEDEGKDAKPYPNEHACRLREPGDFQDGSFARMTRNHEGKEYSVIIGKLKGESTTTEQAYRYPKDTWQAGAAQAHCTSHKGKFEAATGKGVKSAIPYKRTALADEGEAWDGPAEVAAAEVADLRIMCAIVMQEGENKGDYKLPHHKASGHACVWRAVAASMAVCMGSRGGVNAPAADIAGAKSHLAKHYGDFDKPVPGEGTAFAPEHLKDYEPADRLAICMALMDADPEMQVKEGRVLSGKNRGIIQAAMQALEELLAAAEPPMKPADDEGKAEALTAQEYAALRVAVKCKLLELGYRPGIGG